MADGGMRAPDVGMAKPFDIRKRAELFSDDVYGFSKRLWAKSPRHTKLIDQLNDAAGSIGANLRRHRARIEEGLHPQECRH